MDKIIFMVAVFISAIFSAQVNAAEKWLAPSFYCKAKLNRIEKMICDPKNNLGALDKKLDGLYIKVVKSYPKVKGFQKDWI
ncbi:MAG: hypothetical protein QNL04_14065 [SAR324 cluster bacterium]|nr:hypothetical protein [SAR324 cluster bacterium]